MIELCVYILKGSFKRIIKFLKNFIELSKKLNENQK